MILDQRHALKKGNNENEDFHAYNKPCDNMVNLNAVHTVIDGRRAWMEGVSPYFTVNHHVPLNTEKLHKEVSINVGFLCILLFLWGKPATPFARMHTH